MGERSQPVLRGRLLIAVLSRCCACRSPKWQPPTRAGAAGHGTTVDDTSTRCAGLSVIGSTWRMYRLCHLGARPAHVCSNVLRWYVGDRRRGYKSRPQRMARHLESARSSLFFARLACRALAYAARLTMTLTHPGASRFDNGLPQAEKMRKYGPSRDMRRSQPRLQGCDRARVATARQHLRNPFTHLVGLRPQ